MFSEINKLISKCTRQGNLDFKKHALVRIVERKILISEVEEALSNCNVIESYLEDKPLPSYLVLGFTKLKRPLHILVALNKNDRYLWIITVYEPNKIKWNDPLTKRKR